MRDTLVEGAVDAPMRRSPPAYPLPPCSDVDVDRYDCRRSRWKESRSLGGASWYEDDATVGAGRVNGSGW